MNKRIVSLLMALTLILAAAVPAAAAGCPVNVEYRLGADGVSESVLSEAVAQDTKPGRVPKVTALGKKNFLGWSLTDPSKNDNVELVDPTTVRVQADTVFYAVYGPYHAHYVIGYPSGEFGPDDFITRGSVATILARAGFDSYEAAEPFEEGKIYANSAKFTDVAGHWAESAISYCAKYGVFAGYGDGLFKPDQPITRQEFVQAVVNLAKVTEQVPDKLPTVADPVFSDIDQAGAWAVEPLRIAKAAGWIDGYQNGSFLPTNQIRRDETVKIMNAYLGRGVDAKGLSGMKEYIHTGVASNVTENGTSEYMTWPDVPKTHWAYYEIIEAANDHTYDLTGADQKSLPEKWTACWIDERWRYHDDTEDSGPLSGTSEIVQSGEEDIQR